MEWRRKSHPLPGTVYLLEGWSKVEFDTFNCMTWDGILTMACDHSIAVSVLLLINPLLHYFKILNSVACSMKHLSFGAVSLAGRR